MPIVERRFVLTKGPPWGFRIYLDNQNVFTISKIRRHSPAENAKLRSGDQIISLNGKLTSGLSHSEAVLLIDTTFGTLDVQISRFESVSTQVLKFDKVDTKISDDVKANLNMNLTRPEEKEEELKVLEYTPEPEEYFVKKEEVLAPTPNPEDYIIKIEEEGTTEKFIRPSSPEVSSVPISKLMKEYNLPNESPDYVPKKKYFADSSFYNDPYNLYPTAEEKIEMARRVASSLYAPDNKSSKGASIFEKQRKRADKYTLQSEKENFNGFVAEEPKYDLAHWPEVSEHKERSPSPMYRLGYSTGPMVPPPPPPPPAPNEAKTVQEFMEKVQRFPKAKHNVVSPDVCFDIAAALHSSDSRGAQIFAKQKHRAQKWTLTAPEVSVAQPVFAASPGPSNNFKPQVKVDQQTKPKIVSINRNQSQYTQNEKTNFNTNVTDSGRKPTHVIRRNSNQGPPEPVKIGNKLSISTSSNVASTPVPAEPSQPVTGAKWKPVKFNIPQRA